MITHAASRPIVMGVVNVTPDSFSDGGEWFESAPAIAHGLDLVAAGADLVDVGGESTRPGAKRPSTAEELRRVIPVVSALAEAGATVSVDTMRADVAAAAVEAGAALINDVSGGLADPDMAPLVAELSLPFIAMHWRGHSADMQERARYNNVVDDVLRELRERADALMGAGIAPESLILDPGLGFAKTAEHNWEILRALDRFVDLPHRILLGTSRKTFLGRIGRTADTVRAPRDRDVATAVTSAYAAWSGVWAVRVHDVTSTVDALDVATALNPKDPL